VEIDASISEKSANPFRGNGVSIPSMKVINPEGFMPMERVVCGVYCIRNTYNGMEYVGMSKDVWQRYLMHERMSGLTSDKTQLISKAISAYGITGFTIELIENCVVTQRQPRIAEKEHIMSRNTLVPMGYNVRL
jgi:hypothetical protein